MWAATQFFANYDEQNNAVEMLGRRMHIEELIHMASNRASKCVHKTIGRCVERVGAMWCHTKFMVQDDAPCTTVPLKLERERFYEAVFEDENEAYELEESERKRRIELYKQNGAKAKKVIHSIQFRPSEDS